MTCRLVGAKAIIWTNAGILLIGTSITNFREYLNEIHTFSLKKMHLKMSRQFCLGLNIADKCNSSCWWRGLTYAAESVPWLPPSCFHHNEVIMSAMASQITSLTIVYSTVHLMRGSKKTSKLGIIGLCAGNSPVTGESPVQRASNAENVSIWERHHVAGNIPVTVPS